MNSLDDLCINPMLACYNSANSAGVDYKCTAGALSCIKADGSELTINSPGVLCVNPMLACYNSANSTGVDYKCTAGALICIMTNGSEPAINSLGDLCIRVGDYVEKKLFFM